MILDKLNRYSDSQNITGTVVSEDVIDHVSSPSGLGAGKEMMVFVNIEAVDTAGEITINLQTSDDEGFGSSEIIATKVVASGDVVAGQKVHMPIAPDYKALRYTRVQYVAASADADVSAYLVPQDHQSQYVSTQASVPTIAS